MSHAIPSQVLATPVGDLADQSSESLFVLKNEAADRLAEAKANVEHIDRALDLKYRERAHRIRLEAGKDSGIVHFDDGRVSISADLPKKVEWDQARLADITRRIAENGDDPAQTAATGPDSAGPGLADRPIGGDAAYLSLPADVLCLCDRGA